MRFIPILALTLCTLALNVLLEQLLASRHQQQQRVEVLEQLSLVRARLEGALNANLHLLNGISASIAVNPEISRNQFDRLARRLMENRNDLRNIAAAPDLVIRYIYPLEGNEAALGLDYTKNPQQRAAALQARDLNKIVVAGPLNLIQGGTGLIARLPVFYDDADGRTRFWGMVSSVIDNDKLYRHAQLDQTSQKVELAIRGKDSLGAEGDVFYGDSSLFDNHSVQLDVTLPYGSWRLAAQPLNGWHSQNPYAWWVRFSCLLGLVVIVFLMRLRNRQFLREKLSQSTFFTAFEESPLGMAITDPENGRITHYNRSLSQMTGIDPQQNNSKSHAEQLPESLRTLLTSSRHYSGEEVSITGQDQQGKHLALFSIDIANTRR